MQNILRRRPIHTLCHRTRLYYPPFRNLSTKKFPSSLGSPGEGQGFTDNVKEALKAPAPLHWRLLAVASVFVAFCYTVRPFDNTKTGATTRPTKLNSQTFSRCHVLSVNSSPPESGSRSSHVVVNMVIPKHLLPDSPTPFSSQGGTKSSLPNPIYHIYVKDDDMQVERPYTPIHGIGSDGTATFWIKKYPGGEVSNWISRLQNGRIIEVRGPVQQWDWKKSEYDEIVMISGGTGVTAFSQLLRGALFPSHYVTDSINSNTHFTLLHSHRSPSQMPPKEITEDFETFRRENSDRFTERVFVDELDGEADDIPRDVTLGNLDKDILENVLMERGILVDKKTGFRRKERQVNPEKSVMFLICGPEGMIAAVAGPRPLPHAGDTVGGILGQLGFNPTQVKRL